jgi:hypothetical protein
LGNIGRTVLCGLTCLLYSSPASAEPVKDVSYLYKLSTFTGNAPVGLWPTLRIDRANNEIYAMSPDEIHVFNLQGMEIYQIGLLDSENQTRERIIDVAVKRSGDIVYLTQSLDQGKVRSFLVTANFRGEPDTRLALKEFPSDLADFQVDRMLALDGLFYLANLGDMRVAVINEEGVYRRSYDIAPLLVKRISSEGPKLKRKKFSPEDDLGMGDFDVDREGNIVFTSPTIGSAYRLTPDQQLEVISVRGNGAGKFGIPFGIVADSKGNYLVSDILRNAVMIFDHDLKYVGGFGAGRYITDASINAPRGMVIDKDDKVYVSQTESAGVSVFQLGY